MKNLLILIVLFIAGLFFYSLTLRGVAGNPTPDEIKQNLTQATKPLELSPERGRFILTYSLAENKSFSLSKELGETAAPDVGIHDGRYYIFFGPGISILALPFYLIGKGYGLAQVFSFATIIIFASLNLVMIFLIAKNILKINSWLALVASFIFAFGSTSWSYAITLYQHQITTFFILSAFYSVWRYRQRQKYGWIWAFYTWVIYGYSIYVDYPNAILLAPVMVFFLLSSFRESFHKQKIILTMKSSFLVTSLGFLMLMLTHGYYNYVNFGDWKKLSGQIASYKQIQKEKLLGTRDAAEKIKKLANQKSSSSFFKEEDLPRGFAILLFSPDRGLFLYAPIFILGLLGIYSLRKKINLQLGTLLGLIGVNLFLYSSWGDPWGGWAYGPRYLIPSMAVLSIFIGVWLDEARNKLLSSLFTFVLFAYSCFIALLGALTTNQIPPKVEADFLKMKYNFLLNWDYFVDGRSGSFVFNEYAAKYVSLQDYFLIIYISLILIVFALLFIAPLFAKNHES